MSYTKHDFKSGEKLYASQLNEMDEQIYANEQALESKQPKGDYITGSEVDQKIAEAQLGGSGSTPDLSGFLTEEEAAQQYQPQGNYLTEHQKIKTINGQSLIGEGNIVIGGGDTGDTGGDTNTLTTFVADVDFVLADVSSLGLDDSRTDRARSEPLTLDGYDYIRIATKDTKFKWAPYAYDASTNTFISLNDGFVTTGYRDLTDPNLTYYIRVLALNTNTTTVTVEGAKNAVQVTYVAPETISADDAYGYTREYTNISHLLTFENKAVVNGEITDSTKSVLAKLPNCACVEVKLNTPLGKFKVFCHDGTTFTELTDGYSYYAHRYTGDYSSTYYVQVELQDGSNMSINKGAQTVRCYIYEDTGAHFSNANVNLYGKSIAVIGDSIVQGRQNKNGNGTNMVMAKPWSHLVAEACNVEPANFGIGGALVSGNDWKSLVTNCGKVKGYDVVFVCAGTNDYGGNVSETGFSSAFTNVVSTLKGDNTEVVVCTPTTRTNRTGANSAGLTLLQYANIEKEIAETYGCAVIDLNTLTNTASFKKTIAVDGLHPNEVGHKIIADLILANY